MTRVPSAAYGLAGVLALFLAIYAGGLAVLTAVIEAGIEPETNPSDPRLGVLFVLGLLLVSGGLLVVFRWGLGWVIRSFIILVSMALAVFVLEVVIPPILLVGGMNVLAVAGALTLGFALVVHPRWYVIDSVGVILGTGVVALFGLSIGTVPALILLSLLAVYDAISVYGTEHMLSLADGAMDSRLPVLLIIPLSTSALMGEAEGSFEDGDVVVVGLGDAIVPGMLVGSAVVHGPGEPLSVLGVTVTLAALGTIGGIAIGVFLLFVLLARGGPHAGLPLLNGGAIAGYLVGATLDGVHITNAIGLVALFPF